MTVRGSIPRLLLLAALGLRAETLTFEVKSPGGIPLGEARLTSAKTAAGWDLAFDLDASLPAFPILDRYRSRVDAGLCSREFEKEFTHGTRKAKERTEFAAGRARRRTEGGGTSEAESGACPRDALAWIAHTRAEMSQGRMPAPGALFFGSAYNIELRYEGPAPLNVAGKMRQTDRVSVTVKGKASSTAFEMFFDRDPARTPVLIRVPFALGTFSLELASSASCRVGFSLRLASASPAGPHECGRRLKPTLHDVGLA